MTIRERLLSLHQPSTRKMTLFACACLREIWHLLKDDHSKKAIETVEDYINELTSQEEVRNATPLIYDNTPDENMAVWYISYPIGFGFFENYYGWVASAAYAANRAIKNHQSSDDNKARLAKQHQLFDDIFGEIK